MADVKITALPAAGSITAASDVLPLVTGGGATTSKATPAQVTTAALNATAVTVAQGGTGATTAEAARTNLGLGTMSTQSANSVAITAGAINLQALTIVGPQAEPTITGTCLLIMYDGTRNTTITIDALAEYIRGN